MDQCEFSPNPSLCTPPAILAPGPWLSCLFWQAEEWLLADSSRWNLTSCLKKYASWLSSVCLEIKHICKGSNMHPESCRGQCQRVFNITIFDKVTYALWASVVGHRSGACRQFTLSFKTLQFLTCLLLYQLIPSSLGLKEQALPLFPLITSGTKCLHSSFFSSKKSQVYIYMSFWSVSENICREVCFVHLSRSAVVEQDNLGYGYLCHISPIRRWRCFLQATAEFFLLVRQKGVETLNILGEW